MFSRSRFIQEPDLAVFFSFYPQISRSEICGNRIWNEIIIKNNITCFLYPLKYSSSLYIDYTGKSSILVDYMSEYDKVYKNICTGCTRVMELGWVFQTTTLTKNI